MIFFFIIYKQSEPEAFLAKFVLQWIWVAGGQSNGLEWWIECTSSTSEFKGNGQQCRLNVPPDVRFSWKCAHGCGLDLTGANNKKVNYHLINTLKHQ